MKKGMADGVFPEIVRSAERHGMDIYCVTLHLNQNKNNDILPYISSVDIIFIYT
jgi:hypothetical protein